MASSTIVADLRTKLADPWEVGSFRETADKNARLVVEAAEKRQAEYDALVRRLVEARSLVAIREQNVAHIEQGIQELRDYVVKAFTRGDTDEVTRHQRAVARAEDETLAEAREKLAEARGELEDATYDPLAAATALYQDLRTIEHMIPEQKGHPEARPAERHQVSVLAYRADREVYRLNIEDIKADQERRRASGEKTVTSTNDITDSKAAPDSRRMRPGQVVIDDD